MKNVKRVLACLFFSVLLATTVITEIPQSENINMVEAAGKVRLNMKKITLLQGKKSQLKVLGTKKKAKWSSSNKKIVTVSSKGKIVAKKAGKAVVTAKIGKKKYSCKVTVKKVPSKPTKPTTPKYSTGSNVPGNQVVYISDRSVEYNSSNKEFRVFFSLKLKDGETRVATSGNIKININNENNQNVYTKEIAFSQKDFDYWTSSLYGTRYLCCIKVPASDIRKSSASNGSVDYSVYIDGSRWEGGNHKVYNLPEGYDPDLNPEPTPQEVYNANFDKIVEKAKKEGEFSTYGGYCTYGYVSVTTKGDTIEIFEGYDRNGHSVKLTKGSNTAIATVKLKKGTATAKFDIFTFKGDSTDRLNWSNNPDTEYQLSYDTAIANVLKNVQKYNFYIAGCNLQDIGFGNYQY